MIKKLYAVDESGKPVPGAVFSFTYTEDGTTWTVAAFEGGQSGSISLDSAEHPGLFSSPNHVTVTANGYAAAGTDAWVIPDSWQFVMPENPSMMPALTLGALLAAGGFIIYKNVGKKKKIGAFDFKNDVLPYVVPAAVVIGGFIVYQKIFGDSPQDKARQDALDKDIATAGVPTMSDAEIATAANAIKEDLGYSWVSNNFDDAMHQLSKPKNTADVLRLIKAYGTHIITVFGIPRGTFTLEETVTSQLPADDIDFINRYYDAQGIAFKF